MREKSFLTCGALGCAAQDFEKAGQLRDREMELKAQISAITGAAKEGEEAEAEATADGGGPLVTEQDIANIVAQWTGIPVEKVPVLRNPENPRGTPEPSRASPTSPRSGPASPSRRCLF